MAGDLVLHKFGVPAQVHGRCRARADVMETQIISIAHDSSIYHAFVEEKRMRGLPVVDAEDRCLRLLSGWKVSQYLFSTAREAPGSRNLCQLSDIAHSFDGELVVGESKIASKNSFSWSQR
jgi:CBS-domain-containing membrane protein